jgi:hypothetical protein
VNRPSGSGNPGHCAAVPVCQGLLVGIRVRLVDHATLSASDQSSIAGDGFHPLCRDGSIWIDPQRLKKIEALTNNASTV